MFLSSQWVAVFTWETPVLLGDAQKNFGRFCWPKTQAKRYLLSVLLHGSCQRQGAPSLPEEDSCSIQTFALFPAQGLPVDHAGLLPHDPSALEELQKVFNPEMAYSTFVPFSCLLGKL